MLISLLIRLISLYTIALLNSFISGTPLTQDYNAAIENTIDTYITRYGKILSMPTMPWQSLSTDSVSNVGDILKNELNDIKKNWAISIIVFGTYILSIEFSTGYLVFKTNDGLKLKASSNKEISELEETMLLKDPREYYQILRKTAK